MWNFFPHFSCVDPDQKAAEYGSICIRIHNTACYFFQFPMKEYWINNGTDWLIVMMFKFFICILTKFILF